MKLQKVLNTIMLMVCLLTLTANTLFAQTVSLDAVIPMMKNQQNISGLKVVIEDLHFETGRTELTIHAKSVLDKVTFVLQQVPTAKLRIEGHTDNVGDDYNNKILSENRAKSVKDYLVAKGVYSSRLNYVGHGETMPIADNYTTAGKAKNRRVQIVFEALDTRTHYIQLTNGGNIPVVVVVVQENHIEYKTSTTSPYTNINKQQVKEIKFADGNVLPITHTIKDTDKDGISDNRDKCPNEFGTTKNNGCPEPKLTDTDNDGVLDTKDQCPYEFGAVSNNGCPEVKAETPPSKKVNNLNWQMFDEAVGGRLSNGLGATYMRTEGKNKDRFTELIALYQARTFGGEFQLTAIKGKLNRIPHFEGLYWYYGGGAHVNAGSKFNYLTVGIDAIAGLGYNFSSTPLNISLDYKPAMNLYSTGYGFINPYFYFNRGYGVSARYTFQSTSERTPSFDIDPTEEPLTQETATPNNYSKDEIEETTTTTQKKRSVKTNLGKYLPFMKAPEKFSKGSTSLQLGYGLRSNLGTDVKEGFKMLVPPTHIAIEKGVRKNLSLGLIIGVDMWRESFLDYNYRYITAGLRTAYHFKAHKKLDPYAGIAGVYRLVQFQNQDYKETNTDFDFGYFVGCRYFFAKNVGLYAEVGSDANAFYKVGINFMLNRKSTIIE